MHRPTRTVAARLLSAVSVALPLVVGLITFFAIGPAPAEAQPAKADADLRIPAEDKGKGGKQKRLYRKVVVAGGQVTFHDDPAKPGELIPPYAIFTQLKTDDGKHYLDKGNDRFVRVGDPRGTPRGWLKVRPSADAKQLSPDVVVWDTRYLLHPAAIDPNKERFKLYDNDKLEGQALAELNSLPKDYRADCPVIAVHGDEKDARGLVYEVVFYTAETKANTTASAVARDAVRVENLKLEIVFVVDATLSMQPYFDSVKEVIKESAKILSANPDLKGAVRFGLVTYQDKEPGLNPNPVVVQKATDNFDSFIKLIEPLKVATSGSGETAEDVIGGLKTALTESGWDTVSSKHIILVGDASAHLKSSPKSTTGMDVEDVIKLANRTSAGESQQSLDTVYFHALRVKNPDDKEDEKLCKEQFQKIAANGRGTGGTGFQGYYADIEANDKADRDKVSKELTMRLSDAFNALSAARKGNTKPLETEAKKNAFAATIYRFVKATTGDAQPLTRGFAAERLNGREVAGLLVQVEKEEISRLRSTSDLIYLKFKNRGTGKAPDIKQTLEFLKASILETVGGQEITEGVALSELISELPIQTSALKETPESISRMDPKRYEAWLAAIAGVRDRSEQLLQKGDWQDVSGGKLQEKYLFLHLSELP